MKRFKITYHMYPEKDIVAVVSARNMEEAIILAKAFRRDSFSVEEVEE